MSVRTIVALVLCTTAMLTAGCGRGPKMVPVSGVVTVDGQPVTAAAVMLYRKGSPAVSAQTQADGTFQLRAVEGVHAVTITACEAAGPMLDPTATEDSAKAPKLKWIVPQRYSQLEQTDLKAKVEAGKANQFKFDLPAK
jgi:hypothetical protein